MKSQVTQNGKQERKTVRRVKRQARIDALRNDPRASRQRRRKRRR